MGAAARQKPIFQQGGSGEQKVTKCERLKANLSHIDVNDLIELVFRNVRTIDGKQFRQSFNKYFGNWDGSSDLNDQQKTWVNVYVELLADSGELEPRDPERKVPVWFSGFYMEQKDLSISNGEARADVSNIQVYDDNESWFKVTKEMTIDLKDLDVILMRKDPPFDMEYIYTTYILEKAEDEGVLIVNKPSALRDMNEKVYTAWFPECTPLTLITRSMTKIKSFLMEHKKIVIKPLDGMGGKSIFVINHNDGNANVIIETLTDYGSRFAMAQIHIPEISQGD